MEYEAPPPPPPPKPPKPPRAEEEDSKEQMLVVVKKGFDKEDGEQQQYQQQQLSLPPPKPGESERRRGDWESTRIGTGTGYYMVSIFGGWGKEPDGRRLTRPKRERERAKEKKTIADRRSICSKKARIVFDM